MEHLFVTAPSAPRDLVATNSSSSNVLSLEWKRPKNLNGIITEYIVRWTEESSIGNNEEFVVDNVADLEIISLNITDLRSSTCYNVSVQVQLWCCVLLRNCIYCIVSFLVVLCALH